MKRYLNNKILFYSDTHAPYHHKDTIKFLKKVKEQYEPDRVIHGGDLGDMYNVSVYPKDMEHPDSWSQEIKGLRKFVKELESVFPVMEVLESNHDCFDQSTEILVEDKGFIPFYSLEETDKIGTYNIETSEIEYQTPTRIIKDPYNGSLIRVRGAYSVDLLVTNNHRLWCSKLTRDRYKMLTAHNLMQATPGRLYFKDCGINTKEDYKYLSDDMIRLVGWYLTDASSKGKKILFHQRVSNAHKIKDLLDRLEIQYKSYIKDCSNIKEICGRILKKTPEDQVVLTIDSVNLDYWVPNRYTIPNWIYKLSKRQIDILLEILIEADGSYYKDSRTSLILYGTYNFLDQVQTVLIQSGYRANLVKYREKDWKLNISERTESCIDKFRGRISYESYSGMIYCAEVPNDTLVVRRNGRVSITGNSRIYKKAIISGVPRETIVPYKDIIGAPSTWKWLPYLNLTVDSDRSSWHFVHTITGGALRAAKDKSTNVCIGHLHTSFGASSFNNGKKLIFGVDSGCLISDEGSPYKYNKVSVGRPIRGCVMIIDGIPQMIPMR